MLHPALEQMPVNRRVRAILLTDDNRLLFIKRVKPDKPQPYWVAPGGGVESCDESIVDALHRELGEELGATVEVVEHGFVLRHQMADKNLEEHFYICRLVDYDLAQRYGPEFDDPARGKYIPDEIELDADIIEGLNIKTVELREWLLDNLHTLKKM